MAGVFAIIILVFVVGCRFGCDDPVAQSVEHLTFNQVVVGSTPTRIIDQAGDTDIRVVWLLYAFFMRADRACL